MCFLPVLLYLEGKEAYDFIKHREGIEAIFVTKNNNVYLTPGLKGKVEILDSDFKLTEGD